jgi:hypothetical protein
MRDRIMTWAFIAGMVAGSALALLWMVSGGFAR